MSPVPIAEVLAALLREGPSSYSSNIDSSESRDTIGSGFIPLDRANLRAWIDDPAQLKIGCNMPSLKLDATELDAVTDYLLRLNLGTKPLAERREILKAFMTETGNRVDNDRLIACLALITAMPEYQLC